MKKLLIVVLLITLIIYLYKPKVEPVFLIDEYNFYTITSTKSLINTKNIKNYFNEEEIILVKLRFNGIYKNKIGDVYCKYDEIEKFYKDTLDKLELLEKYDDLANIYFDEIRVYTNQLKIDKLLKDFENITVNNYKI